MSQRCTFRSSSTPAGEVLESRPRRFKEKGAPSAASSGLGRPPCHTLEEKRWSISGLNLPRSPAFGTATRPTFMAWGFALWRTCEASAPTRSRRPSCAVAGRPFNVPLVPLFTSLIGYSRDPHCGTLGGTCIACRGYDPAGRERGGAQPGTTQPRRYRDCRLTVDQHQLELLL